MQQLFCTHRHNVFLHWCSVLIYLRSLAFLFVFLLLSTVLLYVFSDKIACTCSGVCCNDAMSSKLVFPSFFVALPQVFVYPSKSTDNCYTRAVCLQGNQKRLLMFWLFNVFIANAQNASKRDILLQQEGMFHPQAGRQLLSPTRNSLAWDSSFVSIGLTGSCNWIELIIDR